MYQWQQEDEQTTYDEQRTCYNQGKEKQLPLPQRGDHNAGVTRQIKTITTTTTIKQTTT